jgi:hypothetical protein
MAGLLQVGERSELKPLIEDQLGAIPLASGPGHDGQIFYAIGLDLTGDEVGPLVGHAGFRYRRILYPVVSSLFGLLEGSALLYGMVVVASVSMALSAGMVAAMSARFGRSELLALAVVVNPGVWLSVQFLTSDAFTLVLMLAGLYAFALKRTRSSAIWFALGALAKDVSVATSTPFGAQHQRWPISLVPLGILVAWMGILVLHFGYGFASTGNFGWPLAGMFNASSNWPILDTSEWFYLLFGMASVIVGLATSFRRSWLQWSIWTWTGLALISSNWVWDFGNNAARAFAPIMVLAALSRVSTSDARLLIEPDVSQNR